MLQRLEGVTRAVFSSSAGREVATAADNKISSDETKLSVGSLRKEIEGSHEDSRVQRFQLRYYLQCLFFVS